MTASRQRRVAVDDPRDLGVAALERADVDELLDQLGRPRADDVAAEQLAVLRLADDLDEAGAVAVDRARADGAVLDLADDDVVAGLLGLLLGQPERGDVRRAERRARDVDVDERVRRVPGGVLGGDDALVGGLVRERGAGDEVADRVDVRRADVRSAPSTSMSPRSSSLTPAASSPRPSTSGPRPAAMTSQSTSPLLAAVGERHRRCRPLSTFSTSVFVWIFMPCFFSPRSTSLEMSASSVGSDAVERLEEVDLGAEPRVGRRRSRRPTRRRRRRRSSRAARSSAQASSVPMTRPPNCVPGIGFGDRAGREDDLAGLRSRRRRP